MRVGDLVKFIGCAKFYKGRIGTVVQTWDHARNSANVYFPGAEGQGRDEPILGQTRDGLHCMAFSELEVIE